MLKIQAILLFAFLPVCASLNCYLCASGLTGCNDPFNTTAYNVTETGSISTNTYCVKAVFTTSFVSRYGASACISIPFIAGIGTACCQTDLCNTAQIVDQTPMLVILSFFIMLFKFY